MNQQVEEGIIVLTPEDRRVRRQARRKIRRDAKKFVKALNKEMNDGFQRRKRARDNNQFNPWYC